MTKLILSFYTVVISLLLLLGCDSLNHDNQTDLLEIHLQERFTENNVRVELNGTLIFEDTVTSNRSGLAKILILGDEVYSDLGDDYKTISKQISYGENNLIIWIDDTLTTGTKFIFYETLFIGIRYNMDFDSKVEILQSKERYTYH